MVEHPDFNREGPGFESQRDHKATSQNEVVFLCLPVTFYTLLNWISITSGACIDLKRRLYEHNLGDSKFTSLGVPWELQYGEKYDSLQET